MSTVVCKYCKSTGSGSKLKCARCHSVYYCNVKCQRADWKQHKSQCERKIILPNVPNIDLNTITKDTIDIQCIQTTKQLRESFNHRKAYTAITNTQCFPTKAILELLTDILLSPLTFWSVQSIDIQFIGNENPSKPISNSCIRNFFKVNIINEKCKQIKFLRCGWVEFDANTLKTANTWQMLMELFAHNDNMSLLFFQPFNQRNAYHFDLLPEKVKDIICNAVVQSIVNFNDYMITMESMMCSAFEGQKVVIQQILEYLEEKEYKDQIIIYITCPGGEFESINRKWSSKAARIARYVNEKIKQTQTENQLQYVKTFDFQIC
eukprot:308097_1